MSQESLDAKVASDSPKWIALVLSVVAIVASTLSWCETRRNRIINEQNKIINEEVNRPLLTLTLLQTTTFVPERSPGDPEVEFTVTLENDGKMQASIYKTLANVTLHQSTIDRLKGCEIKTYQSKVGPQQLDILPSSEKRVDFKATFSSACTKGEVVVDVAINVTYKAPDGTEYAQILTTRVDELALRGSR